MAPLCVCVARLLVVLAAQGHDPPERQPELAPAGGVERPVVRALRRRVTAVAAVGAAARAVVVPLQLPEGRCAARELAAAALHQHVVPELPQEMGWGGEFF